MSAPLFKIRSFVEFTVVALIGATLLGLAYLFAPGAAEQEQTFGRLQSNPVWKQTFLAVAVCVILMIPAYWLFILQQRSGPRTLWRSFWTMSYLAFVVHLYWAVSLIMEQTGRRVSMEAILDGVFNSPDLVSSPLFDSLLFVWWSLDVVIAWLPGEPGQSINGLGVARPVAFVDDSPQIEPAAYPGAAFVRLQRALLHLVLLMAMLIASIPQGQGLVRFLGFLLAGSALLAYGVRIVRRPFYPEALGGKAYKMTFAVLNRFVVWHRLPTWLGVVNLGALRERLRAKNLHGTEGIPVTNSQGLLDNGEPPRPRPGDLISRRDDGCFNDLEKPSMGRSSATTDPSGDSMLHDRSHPGARFGRNVPLEEAFPDTVNLMSPNPRLVSNELMARKQFIPAKILNLIAAAWIQFQTHDWFNHGEPSRKNSFTVPPPEGDSWAGSMQVGQTRPDPTRDYAAEMGQSGKLRFPPTYVNAESHWWDASQIYGNSEREGHRLRIDPGSGKVLDQGRMFVNNHGNVALDPSDPQGLAVSGFVGNWWLGLSLLHSLFVREHNAICAHLATAYRDWTGDQIFVRARMINAALMAKIHTVEWTPAILQNRVLQIGMSANWWGLATENLTRALGRVSPTEAFSGIPNSGVDHHGADFALTEEFVSVYRLHPLMPDKVNVLSMASGESLAEFDLPENIIGPERELIGPGHAKHRFSTTDLWYSFGRAYPGAITLHNYPNYLRKLTRQTPGPTVNGQRVDVAETIDLATIDILRDRERGVPRYNRFRRLFHLKPIKSFDELANELHPGLPAELRKVYGQTNNKDNVEALDLMVGMFAEVPPEGFGFSDTAFRVFILMASRRLKSDRFIAQGFDAKVFTEEGIAWVNNNNMISVLLRHHPDLAGALYGLRNAFVPWHDVKDR